MTLEDRLKATIAAEGPLPLDAYMRAALFDPEQGYYTTAEPFGAQGDFITSPEISQMFGELLGLWLADMWHRLGRPDDLVLAEAGPGRGTLMADALRAISRAAPEMLADRPVWLLEASPRLQAIQRQRLAGHDIRFATIFDELPDGTLLLLANEFLDALPVRQVVRRGSGFAEIGVGVADGALVPVEGPVTGPLPDDMPGIGDGEIFEFSEEARAFARILGGQIAADGGAALLVDYGHGESAAGDTLQAVKAHRFHPVLAAPGTADLTTHVDFAAIARAAMALGARAFGPLGQRVLLGRLGIEARLAQLVAGADAATREGLVEGYRRLTDPDRMGHLFKALCITDSRLEAPTAYEPDEAFRG
ncbi:MAG: SAM-dependent methyltransferase [Pseudomonadota bacterium]|nr:SAM-dependent methyltransferase [Pseudomonadota bacterium]